MPIFAKTKLVIHEDCLRTRSITLSYQGPNPQNLYREIKKLLSTVLQLEEHEVEEREFSWDRSTAEEKFRVTFYAVKDFDLNTYMEMIVRLEGEAKPSKEFGKEGFAKVVLESRIRTEYPQDTFWQRSLIYELFRSFYHKVIYSSARERYREECAKLTNLIYEKLRSFLNLLPKGV